jgi:hypothetical protein
MMCRHKRRLLRVGAALIDPCWQVGIRELSFFSGAGSEDVQVRPEVERATQLVIDGATPKAVLAVFGKVETEGGDPPPAFALAQILSARAVKLLRDEIMPNHQMAHELAAQSRQKMTMGQAVDVSEIADEMAWPQLARLQFKRLTDCLRLSRMACELQVAGYGEAIGDRQVLASRMFGASLTLAIFSGWGII